MATRKNIQLLHAPSILGLSADGTEWLGTALLDAGLAQKLGTRLPVKNIPTLNHLYSDKRDEATQCLNADTLPVFSATLGLAVNETIARDHFALVLGGDCSILLGILSGLKKKGSYGLVFADAHADFYSPAKSTTGEVADMDLAIVTGRGPDNLTNIDRLKPYVADEHVVHIGQRDQAEAAAYHSPDIRQTAITCYSCDAIAERGIEAVTDDVLAFMNNKELDGYWIHYDTDVLADTVNPAVAYRLPGGLQLAQTAYLMNSLLQTKRVAGMSVTIYNPRLDKDGHIAHLLTDNLARIFSSCIS